MKILVIGGTVFVGRHIVQSLLDMGHEVTLFHRGKSGANIFPDCQRILGDRIEDIAKAGSQHWDAIVDSSAYYPRQVAALGEALSDKADFFSFISTISVFAGEGPGPFDESTPLVPIGDPAKEEITGETYGYLKVLCEQEVEKWFPNRNVIVRPGIVFGPNDPTGRFPYWISRLSTESQVLVPEPTDQIIQWIDTRDLGAFTAEMTIQKQTGIFNAAGPRAPFQEMLDRTAEVSGNRPEYVPATLEQLEQIGVRAWTDLPLVLSGDSSRHGIFNYSNEAAVAAGLRLRSFDETIASTLEWIQTEGLPPAKYGMTREEELNAIARLRAM